MKNPVVQISKIVNHLISGSFFFFASDAFSAEEISGNTSSTGVNISSASMNSSYLIQLILGLVVVLVCVVVLSWFARKMNKFNASSNDSLKIISGISMGTREKVILLQAGNEQILVGVTPGNINRLHVLNEPVEDVNTVSTSKSFSNKFKKIMDDANVLPTNASHK